MNNRKKVSSLMTYLASNKEELLRSFTVIYCGPNISVYQVGNAQSWGTILPLTDSCAQLGRWIYQPELERHRQGPYGSGCK